MARSGFSVFLKHARALVPTELLKFTQLADYKQVEAIVLDNPALILQGPAQYAAQVYDRYMWQLFERVLDAKAPHLKSAFESIMKGQADHFNFANFEAKYQEYKQAYDGFLYRKISNLEFNSKWMSLIGYAQGYILPAHMLREFTREIPAKYDLLKPDTFSFDYPEPHYDCNALHIEQNRTIALLPLEERHGLGHDFAVMRTMMNCVIATGVGENKNGDQLREVMRDLAFFKALYEKRKQEFENRFQPQMTSTKQFGAV